MKKLVIFMALILTAVGLFVATAQPAEATSIVASGTCGRDLEWVLDSEGTLTISGTGSMDDYDLFMGAPWHYYSDDISSVAIKVGVTSIGDYAFTHCFSLTSITIPKSVSYIAYSAFGRCYSLTGIWVAEENANYSSDSSGVLFNKNKTNLLQVPEGISGHYTIPEGVTNIGDNAFSCCSSLTSITIPDSVINIGNSALYGCYQLWHVLYTGSEAQWNAMTVSDGNVCLTAATRHYDCTGEETVDAVNKTCSICHQCVDAILDGKCDEFGRILGAAQKFFGYDAENLANANLSDAVKALASENAAAENILARNSAYCPGTALNLQSRIELRVMINNSKLTNIAYAVVTHSKHSDPTATVTTRVEKADFQAYNSSISFVPVTTLSGADGDQTVMVTFYNANGAVVTTVVESMNSNLSRSIAAAGSNLELSQMLLNMTKSAYAFFHAEG